METSIAPLFQPTPSTPASTSPRLLLLLTLATTLSATLVLFILFAPHLPNRNHAAQARLAAIRRDVNIAIRSTERRLAQISHDAESLAQRIDSGAAGGQVLSQNIQPSLAVALSACRVESAGLSVQLKSLSLLSSRATIQLAEARRLGGVPGLGLGVRVSSGLAVVWGYVRRVWRRPTAAEVAAAEMRERYVQRVVEKVERMEGDLKRILIPRSGQGVGAQPLGPQHGGDGSGSTEKPGSSHLGQGVGVMKEAKVAGEEKKARERHKRQQRKEFEERERAALLELEERMKKLGER